jgi:hypothetical protein
VRGVGRLVEEHGEISMTTIDLPLHSHFTGERGYKVVEAHIVDVAPHLAHVATFAVHRIGWEGNGEYRLSNVETGCAISACDHNDPTEVERLARKYLADKTVGQACKAMAKFKPPNVRIDLETTR